MGRTRSHRSQRNFPGSSCTTPMHSFRRSCLTTCSKREQVRAWGLQSLVSEAALESAEVPEWAPVETALAWATLAL